MSFVTLGGDGSTRPTFFELAAAERLMPSLKAAAVYSLSVFAQRRPSLHRILDWEDEIFALITAFLDRQNLAACSASFADGLYGLRRAPCTPGQQDGAAQPLSARQRQAALLCLVVLPYIRTKVAALYDRHRNHLDAALGLAAFRQAPQDASSAQVAHGSAGGWLARASSAALAAFLRVYPWAHVAAEAARFGYQLAYLLDSTPFYSPALHALRQRVVRVSGTELVEAERSKQARRTRQLGYAANSGSQLGGAARQAWLRAGYVVADHTRNALILSVFAFKVLEWWYVSGEEKLAAQRRLPPPPPPPPPLPDSEGIRPSTDPKLCPLCRRKRTNPATTTASGFVFCYPCIFGHISQHGQCPITRLPASLDSIRRLYMSA